MEITTGYGRRVKMARQDMEITQVLLARTALSKGASSKNIGRIEREEVLPRPQTLQKIAHATGVDAEWLATGRLVMEDNRVVRAAGIGARMMAHRQNCGLTMRRLAEESGLGASSKNVSRIERCEVRPRARTLRRVAAVLEVSVEQLAFGA